VNVLRRLCLGLFFIILGVLPVFPSLADVTDAPDFVVSHAQLPEKLSELQGQVVYLDFWASWCKPCRKSFPWMNKMQQKYAPQGLQIIAVNLDSDLALAKVFLDKVPADIPILYDPKGKIASDYKLIGMPSSYLIDRKGQLRKSHKGFFTKKESLYEQEILLLLNEKD
jgi:thiol-disulfide isomerase/thioredoxin